jgi:mannan endo-1,4-beta-mannosidase
MARLSALRASASPLSAGSPQSPATPLRVRRGHVFVGVAVNGGIAAGVRSFRRTTGARIAMVEIYTRFGAPFPWRTLRRVTATGATPLMQWNPRGSSLPRITTGRYDSYLRHYATSVKRLGHRVVLSFGHEMNGTWNSWGAGHARPSRFVAAWRRIHNIFRRAGVRNVAWSWDPSHVGEPPRPWWPGRRYVDKIGIDGYQRPGDTFAHIFADRLASIRHFTSKPVYIAETSVAPGRHQVRQIVDLFNGVQRFHLSGFVWFDINHLERWRLEGRHAAVRAFRRAVARTRR